MWAYRSGQDSEQPIVVFDYQPGARPGISSGLSLKLPRFRGVLDVSIDYGSVLTTSLMASYAIGER